jgi:DNA-binding transcriptional LysR family regulator
MNLSLRQLKGFIGVAATSSFTKTAQRLHLSQAALSTMIRELESQLGCRLFHRSTRTVELTEAGRRFVPIATHAVESIEAAAVDLAEIDRREGVALNIGVTPLIAQSLLPIAINRFRVQAPHVSIGVSDSPPAELQQLTESGRLDAAFGAFFSKASGLDRQPIFAGRLQLVSRRQPDATEPSATPWERIAGQPLITLHESSPIQQLTDAQLAKHGIEPASQLSVNQLETMIAFAEAGLGIGVLPSFAQAACRRYGVHMATLTPAVEFHYHRIMRAGRHASPSLQAFTQLLADVAAEHELPAAP